MSLSLLIQLLKTKYKYVYQRLYTQQHGCCKERCLVARVQYFLTYIWDIIIATKFLETLYEPKVYNYPSIQFYVFFK